MFVSRKMVFVVVMAILVLVGVGAIFADSHDTYTGCLGPGGNLNKVAVGSEPVHGVCPDDHEQISWNETGPAGPPGADGVDGAPGADGADGADGKDGVSGWEQKSATQFTSLAPGGEYKVEILCPTGKKPLGGGFDRTKSTTRILDSRTNPALTGWFVRFINDSTDTQSELLQAEVICATVD